MESGSYGDGYRDARKHAGQEVQILVRNATAEFKQQVALLVKDNRRLREALQNLLDHQNGPPLGGRFGEEWKAAVDQARAALGEEK